MILVIMLLFVLLFMPSKPNTNHFKKNEVNNSNNNKNKKIINDEEIINFAKYDDSTIDDLNAQEILSLIEETSSREIVVYHVIFEYTFLQISKIMKVPLGTILWKYNKTMKYLKERIKL